MCLIAFALEMSANCPLLIAANRDEYWARPTLPLSRWRTPSGTTVYSGRDVQAGGTWLGFSQQGRVAMLTNVQYAEAVSAPRSRGELALHWLNAEAPIADWKAMVDTLSPQDFAGFNLVLGDQTTGEWVWLSNAAGHPVPAGGLGSLPQGWAGCRLAPGIYGLSNASLDTPWPKTRLLKQAAAQAIESGPSSQTAMSLLLQTLQTHTDAHTEPASSALSTPFVHKAHARYGTRSSLIARQLKSEQGWSLDLQEWTYDPSRMAQPVGHKALSISMWGMPTS